MMFKKINKKINRNQRTTQEEDEDNDQEEKSSEWETLDELKELQRLKKRVNKGINVELLNQNSNSSDGLGFKDEKTKTGGIVDAKNLANELDLGHTFSVETNRRDEDADMVKYIEEELAKRKGGLRKNTGSLVPIKETTWKQDDLLFNNLPEHLLRSSKRKNEEMLSNQMLNGIPEFDLGIHEKIRNIEATEEAKMRLIMEKKNKSLNSASNLVPTNIAVNFVQHNRFNIANTASGVNSPQKPKIFKKPPVTVVEEPVVNIGDEPRQEKFKTQTYGGPNQLRFPGKEKATDDYHYERFKKQFKK